MGSGHWTLHLQDGVHTVDLVHGYWSGKRLISVDGQLAHVGGGLFLKVWAGGSRDVVTVGGHSCVVLVIPNFRTNSYDYALVIGGHKHKPGEIQLSESNGQPPVGVGVTELESLNYDDMIVLDAEDLGEGAIGSSYKEKVWPVLQRYVTSPAEIVEELDGETYKVTSQGKTYVIYSPGIDTSGGQIWGNATFALFDIVNGQLRDSRYRFYAINGGNDLGGMFLTEETHDRAVKSLNRKTDWPYLPKPDYPWYGQPHDD